MDKGILLMAYGNKTYLKYAYNMAFSIKHFSDVQICLVCDNTEGVDSSVFDRIIYFTPETRADGQYDHAKNKINLYVLSPFKNTLYLDVDGVVLKDLNPLFDNLKGQDFYIQMVDAGTRISKIGYSIWASNETIWKHFKLKDDAVLPALQTSIMYFEKGKKAKEFFDKVSSNYKNALKNEDYIAMWGRNSSHPDELYFSATMAQTGVLPDKNIQPVFYPHAKIPVGEIFDKYYILSQYGAFGLVRPYSLDLYDRHMTAVLNKVGRNIEYKAAGLYKNKFQVFK